MATSTHSRSTIIGSAHIGSRLGSGIHYSSRFSPSPFASRILEEGKILAPGESPSEMIGRMVTSLIAVERKFGTQEDEIYRLMEDFGYFVDHKHCVMSTPVMTNAGRDNGFPLSACTVPPLDLRYDLDRAKSMIDELHSEGMGTGFNLDDTDDPASILRYLNRIAVDGANSGREDRPVGNMAILSVSHPEVESFIDTKVGADARNEVWKFNISVNVDDEFMEAAQEDKLYKQRDGKFIRAKDLLGRIADAARQCGDPGLVFLHRLNRDNPTPGVASYTTTAPCGEVGLAPGESCQFGYINLAKFAREESLDIDLQELERLTRLMTRVLDNALEISIGLYKVEENQAVMRAKRKIGIGVCGLADLLVKLGLPYASDEGRQLARDVIMFINYISKCESHNLAIGRGSFEAMSLETGNRYLETPGFLEEKYAATDTRWVTGKMWLEL